MRISSVRMMLFFAGAVQIHLSEECINIWLLMFCEPDWKRVAREGLYIQLSSRHVVIP